MPTHESDICIIGGGISSAMLAQKLSELRPGLAITVVEAGGCRMGTDPASSVCDRHGRIHDH